MERPPPVRQKSVTKPVCRSESATVVDNGELKRAKDPKDARLSQDGVRECAKSAERNRTKTPNV